MSDLIEKEKWFEITGEKMPEKQCEILRQSGVRFVKRSDGRPSLSWEAYNRQMASGISETPARSEPNLRAV